MAVNVVAVRPQPGWVFFEHHRLRRSSCVPLKKGSPSKNNRERAVPLSRRGDEGILHFLPCVEVRPHSAIGANIAVEWLIGAPIGMSLTPENSSTGQPRLSSTSNSAETLIAWVKVKGQVSNVSPIPGSSSHRL